MTGHSGDNYRRFTRQLKRSLRQIHRAGEKLFIDYAGSTIGLTDGSRAHLFVAAGLEGAAGGNQVDDDVGQADQRRQFHRTVQLDQAMCTPLLAK